MLTVVTFLWGSKYSADYVERAAAGVHRHLRQPHRFMVLTEGDRIANFSSGIVRRTIIDPQLIGRHCFVRLRLFDPDWQKANEITDRLVCIDLDNVITGPLDPLFDRPETFVVLFGANMANPNPFNCSVFMLRAGAHSHVWREFSLEAAVKIPHYEFPDDQGWIWSQLPDAAGWFLGPRSGIWAFNKGRGEASWPRDNSLPPGARIVAFPGGRDPSMFTKLDWVRRNWTI